MSEPREAKRSPPPVVEVQSGDDTRSSITIGSSATRQPSVVEILSDLSDNDEHYNYVDDFALDDGNDDIEIVAENNTASGTDDVEITGETTLPGPGYNAETSRNRRRQQSRDGRPVRNLRRRRNYPNQNRFYQAAFIHDGQDLAVLSNGDIPEMLLQHQRHLFRLLQDRSGEVSNSIMERINREDELSLDRKMELENIHNRKVLREKQDIAKEELKGYTNNISTDENLLCELCGIVLGEGIPLDFKPDPKFDENISKYASDYHVSAPWFCIRQCYDVDMELSKRVFAAKCGHVFCGRCIKNIGNRPPLKKGKLKEVITILNPAISAPRKCPATGCSNTFTKSKRTFTELFL